MDLIQNDFQKRIQWLIDVDWKQSQAVMISMFSGIGTPYVVSDSDCPQCFWLVRSLPVSPGCWVIIVRLNPAASQMPINHLSGIAVSVTIKAAHRCFEWSHLITRGHRLPIKNVSRVTANPIMTICFPRRKKKKSPGEIGMRFLKSNYERCSVL